VIHGDRENQADLERLAAESPGWDVVIDTCGYQPAVVGRSARALADRAAAYLFISSVNAYENWPAEPITSTSTKFPCAPDATEGTYGELKAGCERAVEQYFPARTITLDAGIILGPHEDQGRLTWWLTRIAKGGPVLAPADPKLRIAPVDARDLARFGLACAENGTYGAFAVPGPGTETMQDMLEACVTTTASDARLVWAPDAFLLEHAVGQWRELPLWSAEAPEAAGVWDIDPSPAQAAGLTWRPIAETVRDTWAWLTIAEPLADEGGCINGHGLPPAKEKELLALRAAHETPVKPSTLAP
jgi:2'-hydroxyisoflavone reductase